MLKNVAGAVLWSTAIGSIYFTLLAQIIKNKLTKEEKIEREKRSDTRFVA